MRIPATIFLNLFTTRETGAGTGLGLAMMYGIVKSHKGYITCDSEPGQGTTFKIYFPAVAGVSIAHDLPEERTEIQGGRELIMVVDDDPTLRLLGRQFLERFGYRVYDAENGETVLRKYRRRSTWSFSA
jgi:two-component system cell cycle sensor histidine kinase/response regulator CckA